MRLLLNRRPRNARTYRGVVFLSAFLAAMGLSLLSAAIALPLEPPNKPTPEARPEAGAQEALSAPRLSPSANTTLITCVSTKMAKRVICPLPQNPEQVALVRTLSHTPCIYGVSWGLEGQSVWTSSGCAARFSVLFGTVTRPPLSQPPIPQTPADSPLPTPEETDPPQRPFVREA